VTPTGTPVASGPSCSSLTINPSAQGTAPYTVNLTVNGQDNASTISKVTFDFGDGQTQDVTDSAGIGTNSISVLQSHIYNNPGSFTATAVLTDASGSISSVGNCSVTITVNNGSGSNTYYSSNTHYSSCPRAKSSSADRSQSTIYNWVNRGCYYYYRSNTSLSALILEH
jgi:hypothetical protein